MTETKRRQGQNGATPKQICPKCGKYLKTAWMLKNRKYKRVGLCCPSLTCDYIVKDIVEIKDEDEDEE
jgi:hypothetical protein